MKKLIVVCGLPGSGKSTLAEAISRRVLAPIFSVDPIESGIIKAGIKKSSKTGLAAYTVAETLADEQLKLDHSVIIDAVNAQDIAKQMWRELGKKHNAELVIVECVCADTQLHRERIEARVRNMHGLPEVTWQDVEKRRSEYTPWREEHLTLDSTCRVSSLTLEALNYIQKEAT